MPIYEYGCPGCGHQFELLQKMSDAPASACPECSGQDVRKLMSQTAFVLKGGGWYKDHYGLKSTSSAEKAPCGADAASAPAACGTGACAAES